MLCGFPPFYDDNNQKLFEAITNCTYEFPSPYFDKVSDKAKDLIKKILVADPAERLNAEQILSHEWIVEQGVNNCLDEVPSKIKEYNAKQRLKKAGQAIIAVQRLSKLLGSSKNLMQ